jgi:hypothetical protein
MPISTPDRAGRKMPIVAEILDMRPALGNADVFSGSHVLI